MSDVSFPQDAFAPRQGSGELAPLADQIFALVRKYVDAQDAETREEFEQALQHWEQAVNQAFEIVNRQLEMLVARVAELESQRGTEGYRKYLVAELQRVGQLAREEAEADDE